MFCTFIRVVSTQWCGIIIKPLCMIMGWNTRAALGAMNGKAITSTDGNPVYWRVIDSPCPSALKLTTVYPKKYAHGFVVLCVVVVMQSFIMISHEVFIHIHQGCFAGTGAIVRLPQCQWSNPDGYGKISQCITTTKHSKAKTVCIFLGIYCTQQIKISWWLFWPRLILISSNHVI